MNAEQIIAEIEWLEQLFSLPDNRTLVFSDSSCKSEDRRDRATGKAVQTA